MKAKITNYGGIVIFFCTRWQWKIDDVVLGYDSLHNYFKNSCYFGGIIEDMPIEIENSSFEVNGRVYNLAKMKEKIIFTVANRF